MNWVPVKFSGFFAGESSSGAGRFLGLVFGSAGEESISSIAGSYKSNKHKDSSTHSQSAAQTTPSEW